MTDTALVPTVQKTGRSIGYANLRQPWQPGQSGNPGGRPKSLGFLVRENTKDGAELVEFALKVLRGQYRTAKVEQRLAALAWLSDRGWGKPLQITEVNSHVRIKLSWDNDASD